VSAKRKDTGAKKDGSSIEFVGEESARWGTALGMELASRDRMGRPARELHAEHRSRVIW
jgi:hypothetical protein